MLNRYARNIEQKFSIEMLAMEISAERIAYMFRANHPRARDPSQYVSTKKKLYKYILLLIIIYFMMKELLKANCDKFIM